MYLAEDTGGASDDGEVDFPTVSSIVEDVRSGDPLRLHVAVLSARNAVAYDTSSRIILDVAKELASTDDAVRWYEALVLSLDETASGREGKR